MSRSHLAALVVLAVVAPLPWLYHDLAQLGESILLGLAVGVGALALGALGALALRRAAPSSPAGQMAPPGGRYACGCSRPIGIGAVPAALLKGSSRVTAEHEAGHHAVGEWLGGRCRSYVFPGWGEGGFCQLLSGWFRRPVDNAAFLYAGHMAAGTKSGAGYDLDTARGFLRWYSADERAEKHDEAERKARAGLAATSAYRRRIAEILHETGTYG